MKTLDRFEQERVYAYLNSLEYNFKASFKYDRHQQIDELVNNKFNIELLSYVCPELAQSFPEQIRDFVYQKQTQEEERLFLEQQILITFDYLFKRLALFSKNFKQEAKSIKRIKFF